MLMPRFTIRTALVGVAVCALIFLVMGFAFRGDNFAWGFTIGLVSLAVTVLVHAAWFGIVWLFAQLPSAPPADAMRLGVAVARSSRQNSEMVARRAEKQGEDNG